MADFWTKTFWRFNSLVFEHQWLCFTEFSHPLPQLDVTSQHRAPGPALHHEEPTGSIWWHWKKAVNFPMLFGHWLQLYMAQRGNLRASSSALPPINAWIMQQVMGCIQGCQKTEPKTNLNSFANFMPLLSKIWLAPKIIPFASRLP